MNSIRPAANALTITPPELKLGAIDIKPIQGYSNKYLQILNFMDRD